MTPQCPGSVLEYKWAAAFCLGWPARDVGAYMSTNTAFPTVYADTVAPFHSTSWHPYALSCFNIHCCYSSYYLSCMDQQVSQGKCPTCQRRACAMCERQAKAMQIN